MDLWGAPPHSPILADSPCQRKSSFPETEEKVRRLKRKNAELAVIAKRLEERAQKLQETNMRVVRTDSRVEGGEDRLPGRGLGDLGREPRLGHREWGLGVIDLLPRKAGVQGPCKKDKCWPGLRLEVSGAIRGKGCMGEAPEPSGSGILA